MNQPIVFLIEDDDDTRPLFKRMLETRNFGVTVSSSEEDALQRVSGAGVEADVVLVNLVKKPNEKMLEIGRNILREGKLAVPVIVIANEYDEEKQGTYVRAADDEYLVYLEDGDELFGLLQNLTNDKSSSK